MNNQYRLWLKIVANMKLSSDASVLRITYEGLTNFQSFMDSNHDSIKLHPKACSKEINRIIADIPHGIAPENAVPGTNIITISTRLLVVATNAVKYYTAIRRMPKFDNMHYVNVLGEFKTDYNAYVLLKKQNSPGVYLVNDRDKENKIIKWVPYLRTPYHAHSGAKAFRYILYKRIPRYLLLEMII